ncbi:MAG: pyridoxamine 5'-phosphate oxidase family protein [Deltaproteobacteria bacterium]|nr:MAG: pyridoxamine 5'-phosphate oxidase family protein [Deltaproteobacteria bacterium]
MDLGEYFKDSKGIGVLATADEQGRVDVAIYARPHVIDRETIAFIMPDRLTHHNLQANNHAAYLFIEEAPGHKGLRLFLSKVREEKDSELLNSIRRRRYASERGEEEESRFLVFFNVDRVLPLIGAGEDS